MRSTILLFAIALFSTTISAQNYQKFHVSVDSTAIFDTTSTDSKILATVQKHTNLRILSSENTDWLKISYRGNIGYSKAADYAKGWAMSNTFTYKAEAICNDGSKITIPDTNPNPDKSVCKDNDGLQEWVYKTENTIRIIE